MEDPGQGRTGNLSTGPELMAVETATPTTVTGLANLRPRERTDVDPGKPEGGGLRPSDSLDGRGARTTSILTYSQVTETTSFRDSVEH